MTSLRLRLLLVIGGAIVVVVVSAAMITFQITDRPRRGLFEESYAQTVQALAHLSNGSGETLRKAGLRIGERPASERIDGEATDLLRTELRRQGSAIDAVILKGDGDAGPRSMVMRTDDGTFAALDFPERPPQPWAALVSYLSFVALGAIAVSLFATARVLGPLRLINRAFSSIRADGTLPLVSEKGPGELRETARALNALSGRLRATTESRMRLVAAAGHDLRTPMTRMRLRAEFLPDGERDAWLRDLAELDAIADSAIRLVREEGETGTFEPLCLGTLARTVAAELGEAGLPVVLDDCEPAKIQGQPFALKRALRNVVENAARHGGGAHLTVRLAEGEAVLRVEDRGPGIPPELLDRVFEPFFRVDLGRGKAIGGVGLGLAIAREIVERHGGSLQLENRAEGGLRQEIRFPRQDAPASSQAT